MASDRLRSPLIASLIASLIRSAPTEARHRTSPAPTRCERRNHRRWSLIACKCSPRRHPVFPQVDTATKALLDAQKAPKKLEMAPMTAPKPTPTTAPMPTVPMVAPTTAPTSAASAWNSAGTWEERDVSAWALADVQRRLEGLSLANISVSNVAALEGHASIISMRGRVKRPFELKCEIEWRWGAQDDAGAGGEVPTTAARGKLLYSEICPTGPSKSGLPAAAVTYELGEQWTVAPSSAARPAVQAELAHLKQRVESALGDFVAELGRR